MYTRDDFRDYFLQLQKIEDEMIRDIDELIANSTDPKMSMQLSVIRMDEVQHKKMVARILEYFPEG